MRLGLEQPSCRSAPHGRAPCLVLAARQADRRGSSGGASSQRFTPPQRLLSTAAGQADRRDTVYTLRLSTSLERGAALSDPTAGVLVCMVALDGTALLRRVPPLNDPELTEQGVRDICDSIDERDAGANCAVALHQAASQRQAGAGPRPRFQEGAVDEISFRAPELGPLSALLVGPEAGRWVCDEVDVSSSRTGHTDRFVCREALGEGGREAAAYLRPVPPGAVVYGSGDASVVVTQEQAQQLYSLNMEQYGELKAQLVAATAVLVGLGSALAYAAGGRELALPFALGGASGVLYQYMLQVAVDSVGAGSGASSYAQAEAGGSLGLRLALGSPAARVALAAGGLLGVIALLQALAGDAGAEQGQAQLFQVQQIVAALAGFLCYKAAVVGVAIMPPPATELDLLQASDAGAAPRRRADRSRD